MHRWIVVALLIPLNVVLADDDRLALIVGQLQAQLNQPVAFTETRSNELLDEPLLLTGELLYTSDGTLGKTILEPLQERVTITPQYVEMERKGRGRRLALKDRPDIGAFYAGMRALLEGDVEALRELFDASLEEGADGWTISMAPQSADLSEFVERLIVSGAGPHVLRVRTEQPNGDWQEMQFDKSPE
jgi:hypothetical protein